MANSEILLVKPVDGLGGEGDQVKVRAGYARNYLLPRKIAVPVTRANKKHIDALKKRRGEREAQELNGAQDLARKLEKASLAFAVKTGEGGKMFGAITATDIHDKLVAAGMLLHNPIREAVAAVSAGVVGGVPLLDLDYPEDSGCDSDVNMVLTASGNIIEIQGTAEGAPFSREIG